VSGKLVAWLALVGAQVAIGYASRAVGGKPDSNFVYHWSTSANVLIQYGLIFGIVLAISREETRELLALRAPRSWSRAAGIAVLVIALVVALETVLDPFLHANREQGFTPKHWEPAHAGAFVASFIVLVFVGPFVEEATFRGLGFSLLVPYGQVLAILATGVLFGLAHGLVEALPVLAALGIGLGYLRARSDSLYPGYILHAAFNALALIVAVT
jgi:membrane protease YdiL (CAAX protease family)